MGSTSSPKDSFSVEIGKANDYTVPSGLTAIRKQTLADVTLPTGWTWVDSSTFISELGEQKFKANYTPADTANYNTVENVDVSVTVSAPKYTVTWKNYDGTVLETDENVTEFSTPTYDGEIPTKTATSQYTYTFSDWTPAISDVTGDVTYTATFNSTVNKYNVTWNNDDGSIIDTTQVEYGTVPTHADPTKEATAQYTYTFSGWTPVISDVTGDAAYTATFNATVNKYNVTWKNDDGSIIDTAQVEYGTVPTHADPTKADDDYFTYTFAGWDSEITSVTGDADYTATYTRIGKHLFAAHSITLGGDIGVNFYVDPTAVGADITGAESATVEFSFDKHTSTVNLKEIKPDENGWYKATCNIPAAYMAHKIHAEVYIDGEKLDETNDYSVQDYAEAILADPAKYDSEKPEKLAVLVKEMLNYGAKAQDVFSGQMNAAAEYDEIEGYSMADVTAEMIQAAIDSNPANEGKTASDMSTVQPESGAAYHTTSLIFLSNSTLRHYFAVPGGSADPGAYDGNQQNYYYYVEKTNISARELDDLQEFTVNGVTFYYSALDYAKAVVESNMADSAKDLAKSVYLYNQAANNYFHVHTPGTAVRENENPATCTIEGSYDEVIYCTECNEEISRETKIIRHTKAPHR